MEDVRWRMADGLTIHAGRNELEAREVTATGMLGLNSICKRRSAYPPHAAQLTTHIDAAACTIGIHFLENSY